MTKLPPSRTADKIIIRLPDGMRDKLAAYANLHGRSMTAEVVDLLEAGLLHRGGIDRQTIKGMIKTEKDQEELLRQRLEITHDYIQGLEEVLDVYDREALPGQVMMPAEAAKLLTEVVSKYDAANEKIEAENLEAMRKE